MEVYVVTKSFMIDIIENKKKITADLSFNEGVFTSQKLADAYIEKRKKLQDPDDDGCTFAVEPWCVSDRL